MTKEMNGDLLQLAVEGHFDTIMHGANCFNTMGAGIAAQIAAKFPSVARVDQLTRKGDVQKLGSYTMGLVSRENGTNFSIFNLYTQFRPGPNFYLPALEIILYKLDALMPVEGNRIGLPMIGSGIGGGDWGKILDVIEDHFSDRDVTIVKYSG